MITVLSFTTVFNLVVYLSVFLLLNWKSVSPVAIETINEVNFCGKIAAAVKPIFTQLSDRCPFVEARIEGMGSTAGRTKRKDLRFYGEDNKILLTGEVKLPGGISAFSTDLIQDAQQKADHANVQFFVTWDVNTGSGPVSGHAQLRL